MNETQTRRPVQPEDLFRLNFLQDARLSPDGQTVVYTISHIEQDKKQPDDEEAKEKEYDEKEYVTLWLLSVASGERRQLTAGMARDTNPQWSPDGKRIAFLSTRGEKAQIYLIAVDGGEAQALTSLKQGAGSGPVWSPDGKFIAFSAGPAQEPPDPKKPYRVTRQTYRFDSVGYLDNVVQDIYVIPAEGGAPKQLTADACHNSAPRWSPDGQAILYLASMLPDAPRGSLPRLRIVDLAGSVAEITGEWGYTFAATWLPDGQTIAFIGGPHGRVVRAKHDLWVVDRQGGEPRCRSAGIKFGVGGTLQPDMSALWEQLVAPRILVAQEGTTAYVQVQAGGTIGIYRIALTGAESWAPVVGGDRSCIALDATPEHVLFAVSTFDNPVDLFIAHVDGAHEQQLTHLNAKLLADRLLPTVEHLLFPSSDGVQVEGWLLKPPLADAPYPTILYNHGGPQSGFGHIFSFDMQMLAGAGYAVLLINFRGSSGYGEEFATQIQGDVGPLEYADLMAGVDLVIERGLADPERLGCCGLSYGGYLSCWIVGHTPRFKAAVPENPVTNWVSMYGVSDITWFVVEVLGGPPHELPAVYQRCSPVTYAHGCTTPTLLLQGEHDYRCPAEQAEQFYAVLKANGCLVEMVRFPESSHAGSILGPPIVRRVQNEALLDWMNRYVLGKS